MPVCLVDTTCKLLTGVLLESAYSLLVLDFLKIHLKEKNFAGLLACIYF